VYQAPRRVSVPDPLAAAAANAYEKDVDSGGAQGQDRVPPPLSHWRRSALLVLRHGMRIAVSAHMRQLYGTRTQNPSLPPLVKEYMPAGRCLCEFSTTFICDTCLDCASNQAILTGNATEEEEQGYWTFKYPRDKNNYGLDAAQCDSAFPGQYEDIERAVKVRKRWGKVTEADLDSLQLTKGMVRAMIYNREVR
jgi:hypothetical protein